MANKLPENTYAHLNEDGEMEIIDIFTGNVVAVQKSREDILFGNAERMVLQVMPDGQRVHVERTLGEKPSINRYRYSDLQGTAIAHLIADGKTVREISRLPGFPPVQIIRSWRRHNSEFEELIQIAKKDRAEYFQEKALDAVANVQSKDDASAAKVKLEAYRWAASVDDPDTFGNKTKISGDPNAPLTLMIDTGIRRLTDPPLERVIDLAPVGPLLEDILDPGKIEIREDLKSVGEISDLSPEEISIGENPPDKF